MNTHKLSQLDRNPGVFGIGARIVVLLAVAALTFFSVGCEDDSDVTITPVCLIFTEFQPSAPLTARMGANSTCNQLELEIVANNVAGIFSLELTFDYVVSFTSLNANAVVPSAVWAGSQGFGVSQDLTLSGISNDPQPRQTVTLGITRVQTDPATVPTFDAGPGTVLATLTFFQTAGTGANGTTTFIEGSLLDAGDTTPGSTQGPSPVHTTPSNFVVGQMDIM